MLNQVLEEIRRAQGSITLKELSRILGVEPNALEGMLQFWVRKGRIQNDDEAKSDHSGTGTCGSSCSEVTECAFIAKMPKTYSLTGKKAIPETGKNQ